MQSAIYASNRETIRLQERQQKHLKENARKRGKVIEISDDEQSENQPKNKQKLMLDSSINSHRREHENLLPTKNLVIIGGKVYEKIKHIDGNGGEKNDLAQINQRQKLLKQL